MKTVGRKDPCPCGSGQILKKCCGLAIFNGKPVSSPEALLRSRYTAHVLGEADYLFRTTHRSNSAVAGVPLEAFRRELSDYCRRMNFLGLTVHRVWPEDAWGVARVSYTAEYESEGETGSISELSDFVREAGQWLYVGGRAPGLGER